MTNREWREKNAGVMSFSSGGWVAAWELGELRSSHFGAFRGVDDGSEIVSESLNLGEERMEKNGKIGQIVYSVQVLPNAFERIFGDFELVAVTLLVVVDQLVEIAYGSTTREMRNRWIRSLVNSTDRITLPSSSVFSAAVV